MTVSGVSGRSSIVAPRLRKSGDVELWTDGAWVVFLGLGDIAVYCAMPRAGWIQCGGQLERLDLRGHYDPGGFHRIEFDRLGDGDLLVTHEIGATRLSKPSRLIWQHAHRDVTAWRYGVTEEAVWFRSQDGYFAVRLSDGEPSVLQTAAPETL